MCGIGNVRPLIVAVNQMPTVADSLIHGLAQTVALRQQVAQRVLINVAPQAEPPVLGVGARPMVTQAQPAWIARQFS